MGTRQKLGLQEWMSHRRAYRLSIVSNRWLLGNKRLFQYYRILHTCQGSAATLDIPQSV
jgi:hypothetical protein